MMALLLMLTTPPMCRAEPQPSAWAWASASCERSLPALRALAEAAEEHDSFETFTWARRALADRSVGCHELLPASWSPVFSPKTRFAAQSDSWRWLADVGSRSEALAIIANELKAADAHWVWAFAWSELTTAPCPTRSRATLRRCAAFAHLRAGNWQALFTQVAQGEVTDPEADAALTAIALERLERKAEAIAIVHAHPRMRRLAGVPLASALDALASGIPDDTIWNQRLPEIDALEPGHALKRLTHSPDVRIPMENEFFMSFSFD